MAVGPAGRRESFQKHNPSQTPWILAAVQVLITQLYFSLEALLLPEAAPPITLRGDAEDSVTSTPPPMNYVSQALCRSPSRALERRYTAVPLCPRLGVKRVPL